MRLAEVVEASARVAGTAARGGKVEIIAEVLRRAAGDDLRIAVAFLSGRPTQRTLGVGWATMDRDVPPAAEATLDLAAVDAMLETLAAVSGPGSAGERRRLLAGLLGRATPPEQTLLRGLVSDGVRQGAQEGVVVEAVARAFAVPAAAVRRALMLSGDLAAVAAVARDAGRAGLDAVGLRVGRPVLPMLAGSAPDVGAAAARLGEAAWEWKLDGVRVQVHRSGPDVAVFTRTLDDITSRVPEVVEAALAADADMLVLDGEVIALLPDGRPRPFQETAARVATSTGDPGLLRAATPLTAVFFDVLHHDGADLLEAPLAARAEVLASLLGEANRVPRTVSADPEVAAGVLRDALARGHEGVVAKDTASAYAAGRRGTAWIKVKPRHTLDLVVTGVEWGSGRRRGLLSNIHLAARTPDGGLAMVGRTFKGMTDEMLRWQTEQFLARETGREGHVVHVRPEVVVEVAIDGVQRSRRYGSGVALRFARVLRYRPDKTPAQADTLEAVRAHLHPGA